MSQHAAHPSKWYILFNFLYFLIHIRLVTSISQKQWKWNVHKKWGDDYFHISSQFKITQSWYNINSKSINLSYHFQHIMYQCTIKLSFYHPFFLMRVIQCEKFNPSPSLITPQNLLRGNARFHALNKGWEIHLPQIVEQLLRDMSLPFS